MRHLLSPLDSGDGPYSLGKQSIVRDLLYALSSILKPSAFLFHIYDDISKLVKSSAQRQIMWKELVSLLAAGKVLSASAEASHTLKDVNLSNSSQWVADGSLYTSWLGQMICHMATKLRVDDTEAWKSLSQITERSLGLGYSGIVYWPLYLRQGCY